MWIIRGKSGVGVEDTKVEGAEDLENGRIENRCQLSTQRSMVPEQLLLWPRITDHFEIIIICLSSQDLHAPNLPLIVLQCLQKKNVYRFIKYTFIKTIDQQFLAEYFNISSSVVHACSILAQMQILIFSRLSKQILDLLNQ